MEKGYGILLYRKGADRVQFISPCDIITYQENVNSGNISYKHRFMGAGSFVF